MSSTTYSTQLRPDPWLRIVVIASGQLLIAAALVVILTLPLHAVIRALGCVLCCALGKFELDRLRLGFRACIELRVMAGGDFHVQSGDHQWHAATLLTGSRVIRNFAWLRLKTADGTIVTELLRGEPRRCTDWRRLQVIWRHIGAG